MTCLMNEWPTLVLIGLPPFSRMTSGTTRDVMRLCRMIAPGYRSSMPFATNAVTSDPLTPFACSSIRNTRSASPSNASPRSAPNSVTVRFTSDWFSGLMGSAGWLGNVPSRSMYSGTSLAGSRSNSVGTTSPAIPLAASATTVSDAIRSTSANVSRWSRYCSSMSRCSIRSEVTGLSEEPRDDSPSASARTSRSPLSSPTGAARSRQSFNPLYRGGLWLAVNIAPGSDSRPEVK